ncbi:MAG: 6-phosphogluconolactonase [Porticoccaceae bacterium]|nr:6-phosphogluconolactonase [Porticoccaceae bacterium]
MDLQQFENASALDMALADEVSTRLRAAIESQGSASLVVSGGRTPLGFFHGLSQQVLDWSKVTVSLADERWVDNAHQDSNEKLVRENLLINEACCAQFLALKNAADTALAGAAETEGALSSFGKFTVVILGMGDDGHTASLFPGAAALDAGLDLNSGRSCLAVTPTAAPHERISLTLPRLLDTEYLVIHISGANKQKVLEQAQAGQDVKALPIRAILQQTVVPVTVFWAS